MLKLIIPILIISTLPTLTYAGTFTCVKPYILDGDTFDCAGTRVRLKGIDTPEMAGHCQPGKKCVSGDAKAAKRHLISLTRTTLTCKKYEVDKYNRVVATCHAGAINLSCAMLASGHAVRRYAPIKCE